MPPVRFRYKILALVLLVGVVICGFVFTQLWGGVIKVKEVAKSSNTPMTYKSTDGVSVFDYGIIERVYEDRISLGSFTKVDTNENFEVFTKIIIDVKVPGVLKERVVKLPVVFDWGTDYVVWLNNGFFKRGADDTKIDHAVNSMLWKRPGTVVRFSWTNDPSERYKKIFGDSLKWNVLYQFMIQGSKHNRPDSDIIFALGIPEDMSIVNGAQNEK